MPSERVDEALAIALRQVPPPSIREVSLSLGLQRSSSWLVKRFPEQCRALVQRSKEYRQNRRLEIENILRAALTEEPPPTIKELAKRIGHRGGSTLRLWFPDLYGVLAERSSHRRDSRLAQIQSVLETAVKEEPPPSGESVAARIGVTSSHLSKLFPEIWRELVARYAIHKRSEHAKNRHLFLQQVRNVAQELLRAGKYPSRRRVRSLITESNLQGNHLIPDEVKRVVDELTGPTDRSPRSIQFA